MIVRLFMERFRRNLLPVYFHSHFFIFCCTIYIPTISIPSATQVPKSQQKKLKKLQAAQEKLHKTYLQHISDLEI